MEIERNRHAKHLMPLWDGFVPRVSEVSRRTGTDAFGVICPRAPGHLDYIAAVEVLAIPEVLPHGMVSITLPPATWAVFSHRGPTADLDHTVNYIYASWLLQSGRAHAYHPDVEIYGSRYRPGEPESIVVYAISIT